MEISINDIVFQKQITEREHFLYNVVLLVTWGIEDINIDSRNVICECIDLMVELHLT